MGDLVEAVLDDYQSAPIDGRMRAMLAFLDKATPDPSGLEPADLEPLRAAGLSDAAIEEAIEVAFVFNVIDRLADAFGYPISNEGELRWITRFLTTRGAYEHAVL